MKKALLIAVALAALSGCVSTKNVQISQQELQSLKPNNLGLTKREKPDFAAMTADKAMFALVGAVAMISAGNSIVEENEVEDPARYIQSQLAEALSSQYGYTINAAGDKVVDSIKAVKIAEAYAGSDLVLDIETVNWSFGYFPTDWNNYRVIYSAKLRLVNTKTKSIIAEGFCSRVPEEDDTAPSYDELLANKAERLKQELKIAADTCIGQFKTNVLSIHS